MKLNSECCSLSVCECRTMAEASISVDQDQFMCPFCLDLLMDPVAVPCGHSFCKVCINNCWDQEDQTGVYSCPQCRETFTPRPVLDRNNTLSDEVSNKKETELRAASPAYSGPGDVECDFCTEEKHKAVQSCLICLVSLCEIHIKPHLELPALKNHKLEKPSTRLREKICPQHDKLIEIYCRTDQTCICYLCTMHEHRGHDTVATVAERAERQSQLKEVRGETEQRIQEKEKLLQELKQAVNTLKSSAQTAVEDSERIFTELIRSIEERRSEVTELIRAQEKSELSRAEEHIQQLEQEISDLKRRDTELEQLSHTDDHIQFLQSFQGLFDFSEIEDNSNITISRPLSFDGVKKYLSGLKYQVEEFCKESLNSVSEHAESIQIVFTGPNTREDLLQYFRRLSLDPNTAHQIIRLSENNTVARCERSFQSYPDHTDRFQSLWQVLSKQSVRGRCYWEVSWSSQGCVYISVSYKSIYRAGRDKDSWFGGNDQSWSLQCSSSFSFLHNNIAIEISAPSCSRIGVYVDHDEGTLAFYSVSDTVTLLHTVHTTFTQPLYAGFGFHRYYSTAKFWDP